MFQVERKKFYQALTRKTYDAGKKLTKAEKMEKEQKEAAAKLAKLKGEPSKAEPKSDKDAGQVQPMKMDVDSNSPDMP